MNQAKIAESFVSGQAVPSAPHEIMSRADLEPAIAAACARIAPLWPLERFVAVNPFLGLSGLSFDAACSTLNRIAGTEMLMPRAFYRDAMANGTIEDRDLHLAFASSPHRSVLPADVAGVKTASAQDAPARRPALRTVEDVVDSLPRPAGQLPAATIVVNEISKWCAGWFDAGQSAWRLPARGRGLYAAWCATMRHDLNPELLGVKTFRRFVASLPADPVDCIVEMLVTLSIPRHLVTDYCHRALFDIGGWAAYARFRGWDRSLAGEQDDTLLQLLAIRLAWSGALMVSAKGDAWDLAWASALADAALMSDESAVSDPELALDLLLHDAYERAQQRRLLARLSPAVRVLHAPSPLARKPLQAAFCIDVRSEVFRRALEQVCPVAETIGFAGFFGFPIEYVPIGHTHGKAQCPVLLKPTHTVCESVADASDDEEQEILGLRLLRRRAMRAWKSFKSSAISSFTYVETMGLLFAGKIVGDSLGYTRTVADPNTDGLDARVIRRMRPRIEPRVVGDRETGFDPARRLAMAETMLRAMSLTDGFARLVMLTGHGATTVNNPHAAGLDCGACGGHSGEANARVAAQILNDPQVRASLAWRGIRIPDDTWFIGCLHDTTTDEIRIFDADEVPVSHAQELAQLRGWLARAAALARGERAPRLGLAVGDGMDAAVRARSRDWSQVRPEWGLASNKAFIAAPRACTVGVDLGGAAFLHSYDWRQDRDFRTLELIMTAPMVVASWINLQYYGSTVNNRAFGAGNKVLHNVVAGLGVLEGNAGDLRTGLPWQSVHDGERLVHEPLRLNVFIAAPTDAIDAVLAKHQGVRELVDNRWVHLFALNDAGWPTHRYATHGTWASLM